MFWFGEKMNETQWLQEEAWSSLSSKRIALANTSIESIIEILDLFGKTLNEDFFKEALPGLAKESGFSVEETLKTLKLLPVLLRKESLEKRICAEFTKLSTLDRFTKLPYQSGLVKAVPQGILLHVTAGNIFLSSIDSLIMGFLTKNLSLLKVSSQNKFFPNFFAGKLKAFDTKNILSDKFAILHWKGGDTKVEDLLKSKVNAIIAWGGEEMISSYRRNLPLGVKLLDFGPKISLQVITKKSLQNKNLSIVAKKIVEDIIPWDQSACASPQNLYLEEGIDENDLLAELEKAFNEAPPRGELSQDEATEILKEKYRSIYSELMEGGKSLSGKDHLIHVENNRFLKPSPLNRSLIVKHFSNAQELYSLLEPFSFYLQSCSYLLDESEKEIYLNLLSLTGLKRFAPIGTITWGMDGAPHDGRFVLRELVSFISDEARAQDYGEDVLTTNNSKTIKSHFETTPHPPGYIFSSGGTTGEPKYLHFSYEEFDFMSDMLAENFKRHGLKRGMTVANLFVAGNLWSSFMCVEKALEKIGVIQLPIGGMSSSPNILMYLQKFKPEVLMGIPSMLVLNAEFAETNGIALDIPMVLYAGEALSEIRQEYLSKVWKTKVFGSAGYASVDAGVIGYQCAYSKTGEHHVFTDQVELNIVEEEAIVTSLVRSSMPIKNYQTGDKIEWIHGACQCGSTDKRFKLLGRVDNVIQIWSCRLLVEEVEKALNEAGIRTFQLVISEVREANLIREKLKIVIEGGEGLDTESFLETLYRRTRDVKDTIKLTDFKKDTELQFTSEIARNPRTGKISLIQDNRR